MYWLRNEHAECTRYPLATVEIREGNGLLLRHVLQGFAETKTPKQNMHWVYTFVDSTNAPLYIGLTGNFLSRAADHSLREWTEDAVAVHLDLYCCRSAASHQEARQIHERMPKRNIQHNVGRIGGTPVPGCAFCHVKHGARRIAQPDEPKRWVAACNSCGGTEAIAGPMGMECAGCSKYWLVKS